MNNPANFGNLLPGAPSPGRSGITEDTPKGTTTASPKTSQHVRDTLRKVGALSVGGGGAEERGSSVGGGGAEERGLGLALGKSPGVQFNDILVSIADISGPDVTVDVVRVFADELLKKQNMSSSITDAVFKQKNPLTTIDSDSLNLDYTPDDKGVAAKLNPKLRKAITARLSAELLVFVDRNTTPRTSGLHNQLFGSVGVAYTGEKTIHEMVSGFTRAETSDKLDLKGGGGGGSPVANLGAVLKNDSLNFMRSARPTDTSKVMSIIQFSALSELDNGNPPIQGADGTYTFEAAPVALFSFMDNSYLKDFSLSGKGVPERTMLPMIQTSVDSLFPNEDPTEANNIKFFVACEVDGVRVEVEVTAEKPTFFQLPFSFSEKATLYRARQANKPAYKQCYKKLTEKWGKSETSTDDMKLVAAILQAADDNYKAAFESIAKIVHGRDFTNDQLMSLSALKVGLTESNSTLFGLDLTGKENKVNGDPSGSIEFMLEYSLQKELGIIPSVSCKSGQDRTGTAVALMIAMDNYKDITGDSFMPSASLAPWDDPLLKFLFTKAADEFTQDSHILTRGVDKSLKAEDQVFFSNMYIKDVEQREKTRSEVVVRKDVKDYKTKTAMHPTQLELSIEPESPIIFEPSTSKKISKGVKGFLQGAAQTVLKTVGPRASAKGSQKITGPDSVVIPANDDFSL